MSAPGDGGDAGEAGDAGERRDAGAGGDLRAGGVPGNPGDPANQRPGPGGGGGALTRSGAGRLLGVLVSPGDTFRSIAVRPTWLAPLLVLAGLAITVGWMASARIDVAQLIRHQNEATGSQLNAEQVEQRIELVKKIEPYGVVAQGLIAAPALYLLCALLFWVGFKLLGSEMSYKAAFSTALYGFLPLAVEALLAVPVLWNRASLTQDEARNLSFLVDSLAAAAPEGTGRVVLALLGSVNLFSIWAVVLLVIGYSIVARVSRAASAAVVLGVWLLGIALKVALVALAPG
ncbi:MAG: YIP1 family protein [Acidobacteria bacterium]|nr:YIP1 family protein [Acidobacteriota bacterium]